MKGTTFLIIFFIALAVFLIIDLLLNVPWWIWAIVVLLFVVELVIVFVIYQKNARS
jgi:hypothetical protein